MIEHLNCAHNLGPFHLIFDFGIMIVAGLPFIHVIRAKFRRKKHEDCCGTVCPTDKDKTDANS